LLDPIALLSGGIAVGFRMIGARVLGGLLAGGATDAAEGVIADVSNSALRNTLRELYRTADEISGGTAGAIRREVITGQPTKGTFHLEKGVQRASNLRRILTREILNAKDRGVAQRELKNLEDAIRFAKDKKP
jgi:hypothetical protein